MKNLAQTFILHRIEGIKKTIAGLIPDRAWSTVAGGQTFDGRTLEFDGGTEAETRLRWSVEDAMSDLGGAVIWEPISSSADVQVPAPLRRGWTLALDGDSIVVFQRIVFCEPGIADVVAETAQGRFLIVATQRVSAWNGAAVNERIPAA